jgi:DNA polymerase I
MFKVEFVPEAREWYRENGEVRKRVKDYHASFYVAGDDLNRVRVKAQDLENVRATCYEQHRLKLRGDPEKVLRIDVRNVHRIKKTAGRLRKQFGPGNLRFFDVDMTPQFRYCLDTGTEPQVDGLEKMELEIGRKQLADGKLEETRVNGERLGGNPVENLEGILKRKDPDVLEIPSSRLIEEFREQASEKGVENLFGRVSGFQKLAGENNYESFGRTGFSPARYDVPGRVIIDRSNSFFTGKTGIEGMKYLSRKSLKPLQEVSWASIGNVLTSIEIREARSRDVLIPWNKWQTERFKSADQLHSSDRGGFIFSPEPGVYRDVEEADFSSLYPNIMVEKNISPDSLLCECCENSRVPELGYNVCEKPGFLSKVLGPLIEDRDEMKRKMADDHPDSERLEAMSDAIKWILVSCFGYQGYRNAKFGRIECHEAINAHAREIMLKAKERFERNGWEVRHGIIDSIWVSERSDDAKNIDELCGEVSELTDIRLEHENSYEWIAFVPRKNTGGGALNRYFGKKKGGGYKFRGIEARQDSLPEYVREAQREMIRNFESEDQIIQVLEEYMEGIGEADREELVIRKNVSRRPEEYEQYTRSVAAMERYRESGIEIQPGEKVGFYVHDDSMRNPDRVRLEFEDGNSDTSFYRDQLISAAVTVLSTKGWSREDVVSAVRDGRRRITSY